MIGSTYGSDEWACYDSIVGASCGQFRSDLWASWDTSPYLYYHLVYGDIGMTILAGAPVGYGELLEVMPWTPDGITEDFEREHIAPWLCEPGTGGQYWMKWTDEEDTSTLPNAEEGYEDYEDNPCCPCTLGWFVIPSIELHPNGYGKDGAGVDDAIAFEIDLTDPTLVYAKLSCAMDFEFVNEDAYIEFSLDWDPSMDMRDATWTTYWHNPILDTNGWMLLDELVPDDRFVLDEFLGDTVYVRFRLTTPGNGAAIGLGWAIDGLKLEVKHMGEAPQEDTQPPVTEICFDSDTGQVFLLARDLPEAKNCGVRETLYRIDGGSETEYIGPFPLDEGTHTVEYWSVDNCDNEEAHKQATFTIDTEPPTVALVKPEAGKLYLFGSPIIDRIFGTETLCIGRVPIEATADDGDGSGVARVVFDMDAETGYAETAPYTYMYTNMHFGKLVIKARAVDNKGLVSDPDEMTVTVYSLGLF
jgi:hypothetical protein